jgi:hypothetical protein
MKARTAAPTLVFCAVLLAATMAGSAVRADNLPLGSREASAVWVFHPRTGGEVRYVLEASRGFPTLYDNGDIKIYTWVAATKLRCRTKGLRRDRRTGQPITDLCADGHEPRVLAFVVDDIPSGDFRFDTLMSSASLRTRLDDYRLRATWSGGSFDQLPVDGGACTPTEAMLRRQASATGRLFGTTLTPKSLAYADLKEGANIGGFPCYG